MAGGRPAWFMSDIVAKDDSICRNIQIWFVQVVSLTSSKRGRRAVPVSRILF